MGVATGCGFKEIYRFPHTTYPYSSCICTFCSSIPTFLFIVYSTRACFIKKLQELLEDEYEDFESLGKV